MEWTFKPGLPIYTQIIDQIKMGVASGAFKSGQKLPSVREMALEAQVNPNTMQRALAELERDGIVYAERTSGRFVTKEEGKLNDLQKSLSLQFVGEFFRNLEKLGMSKEEIVKEVTDYIKNDEEEVK